jgi:import receptor subunit TOM22
MPSYDIEEETVGGKALSSRGRPSASRRALHVATKLLFATGRAAWVLGTTLLVLGVPLIIEMDREAQAVEMEQQAMGVLSGGAAGAGAAPST